MLARFVPFSIAIVTPFNQKGALDLAAVPKVVQYYLSQGAPGLLVSGSTGEQHCMTIEERKQLFHQVSTTVAGKCPLYAGVAAFKTQDAAELVKAAKEAGFAGIMLGFPPYRRPSQQEALSYVKQVAEAAPELPFFLYNNPPRNGFDLEPETFVQILKEANNIYGLKEAGKEENVNRVKSLLEREKLDQMSFFSGSDKSFVDAFSRFGYTGLTSVAGSVYPSEIKRVVEHLVGGRIEEAEQVMQSIVPGIELLQKAGMLQSIKYVLRKRNVPVGYCPSPLLDISDEHKRAIDKHFSLD
ncbi:4-hydroxy-tetrahydrodipicolinate synthase 1 [Choanephora cucurbitarum]|uniref:4-hydroxy-tetrahydrodipicolinate synthase 1 n=1 Tax=Choanephora cucurbitarum TaxID=101091 RepID=A0A1C7N8B3_9FUNG|nr:4-hydroxy-tetrahydrodipicolinate synthase 1 [Choanephora cucurbitarum]